MKSSIPYMLGAESFTFNKKANGGEAFSVIIKYTNNGEQVLPEFELMLSSYGNSAVIRVDCESISPTILRELANKLESDMIKYDAVLKDLLKKETDYMESEKPVKGLKI